MNKRIILFNIIYYAVTVLLIKAGWSDPSGSLGYGYFIVLFWIAAGGVLAWMVWKRKLRFRSWLDVVGIFLATPVPTLIFVFVMTSVREREISMHYVENGGHTYMVKEVEDKTTDGTKIEYFRCKVPFRLDTTLSDDVWVEDSTWIYLSHGGDTIRKEEHGKR